MTHIRNRHFFIIDLIALPLAAYFSYILRLERLNLLEFWPSFAIYAASAILLTPLIFRLVGIYGRYWPYASVQELLSLTGALTLAAVACGLINLAVLWSLPRNTYFFPRSVPFIFVLLSLVATAAPRLATRVLVERPRAKDGRPLKPVAIMGAGDAGEKFLRELKRNTHLGLGVIAFLDDDPQKQGVRIHGVPVLGTRHDIERLAQNYGVQQIIIALPTAAGPTIREIVRLCEAAGVQTKILPSLHSLLTGTASFNQLRDVELEDLLRRDPVRTDVTAVRQLVEGKRILVTGGGGSIGSELCRQLLSWQPAQLVLVGHSENPIFDIYHELREQNPGETDLVPVIADVRFSRRIASVLGQHRPDIVFHAAAHKHVPLMEYNPSEAVINNVIGTRNLLAAALAANVERFVMISTDKAVNPTSIMGASKRTAELLVHQAAQASGRPYVAVRFGNVLASSGSVVHTFRRQIRNGGPVTVTHQDMERYFMTIPEAAQLVLQAGAMGRGGEVFVLDMGQPIKIYDLARDLIELSGLQLGRDIDIVITGLRPGEKLTEELFLAREDYARTEHAKIFIARNASQLVPPNLNGLVDELATAAHTEDLGRIIRLFKTIIPENRLPAPEDGLSLAEAAIL